MQDLALPTLFAPGVFIRLGEVAPSSARFQFCFVLNPSNPAAHVRRDMFIGFCMYKYVAGSHI